MIKLLPIISEIKIKPDFKKQFEKYVIEYYNIINNLRPIISKAYKTQNFKGLSNIIIEAFLPIKNKMIRFEGDWDSFRDWLKDIENEDLPIKSSGSFATALLDTEWINNQGERAGLSEEECDDIINKINSNWINESIIDKKQVSNIDYYQQILNQSRLSTQSRNYVQGVISSIKKQNNFASPNQISILQKFKIGNI